MEAPVHDDIHFLPGVMFGWRMKNYSAGTAPANHIVCIYATPSDTVGFVHKAAVTTLGQGGYTFSKNWGHKVAGVAMESIAAAATGNVAWCGLVDVSCVGTIVPGKYLCLSTAIGMAASIVITGAATLTWGGGRVFGISVGNSTASTVKAFVFPWRV